MLLPLCLLARKQRKRDNQNRKNGLFILGSCDHTVTLQPIPQIDTIYYCYDDGKIRKSREYKVIVRNICTYKKLPVNLKRIWQKEVINGYWLYAPKSDVFIEAEGIDEYTEGTHYWFARTQDGGWFGFGTTWDNGRLDVTGELKQRLESYEQSRVDTFNQEV